jgi:G3E family GTPase
VVDADQVFAHPEYPPLMDLKLRQVGFADMLILNKVGLAGPEQVTKVRAWLDDRFNRLRIVEANYCEVPNEILLGVGRFDPAQAGLNVRAVENGCTAPSGQDDHHGHDPSKVFGTWSYETDQPLAMEPLRETLRKLPGTIYRVKGVVHVADGRNRPAVLQVVGRRVDMSLQGEWGVRTPRTRIVLIGEPDGIDPAELRRQFEMTVAPTHDAV